jgi:hypothetical protein
MGVRVWSLAVAALACLATPAGAAPGRFADPSYHCDGRLAPPPVTTAVAEAVISGMTLGILGLVVPFGDFNRHADVGVAGVAACDVAIAQAPDAVRRSELTLARAVHRLEAKDIEGALSDARGAPALAGAAGEAPGYRRSLGLSALDIEAIALVASGRTQAAREIALRMAAAAPYDVAAARRALPILILADGVTPAERDYFAAAGRLDYRLLGFEQSLLVARGEYDAAVTVTQQVRDHGLMFDADEGDAPPVEANLALLYALKGDLARSDLAALRAAAGVSSAGGVEVRRDFAEVTAELLAATQAVRLNAEGRDVEARAILASHRTWLHTPQAEILAVLDRLSPGAPKADQRGVLSLDLAKFRAEVRAADLARLTGPESMRRLLWSLNYEGPDAYAPVADKVRTLNPSPFEVTASRDMSRSHGRQITGSVYALPEFRFDLGRQALLLHCALIARARGARGFVLGPAGQSDGAAALWVQYGDPGRSGFPVATAFVADEVIADLSDRAPPAAPVPPPPRRQSGPAQGG